MLDRNNNVVDTKTTEKLTIVPKPEPEVISLTMSTPAKLKYATGEPILINWTVKNLQKLAGVEILGKSKDGSPYEQKIVEPKLSQDSNCKQDKEKQQIVCTNFPLKIAQPSKYELQIKPISKSEAKPEKPPTTAAPAIEFEVLPKSLKIGTFTINGTTEPSRIVKEGEMLTINWQVDGDEKINVELLPGGTVARSGTQQMQSIQSISQISLVATDNYGHKETKVFSIKVEPPGAPSSGTIPTTTPTQNLPSTGVPGNSGSKNSTPNPSPDKSPGKLVDP